MKDVRQGAGEYLAVLRLRKSDTFKAQCCPPHFGFRDARGLGSGRFSTPGGGGWFREEETLWGERKIAFGIDAEECDIQLSQPHI